MSSDAVDAQTLWSVFGSVTCTDGPGVQCEVRDNYKAGVDFSLKCFLAVAAALSA